MQGDKGGKLQAIAQQRPLQQHFTGVEFTGFGHKGGDCEYRQQYQPATEQPYTAGEIARLAIIYAQELIYRQGPQQRQHCQYTVVRCKVGCFGQGEANQQQQSSGNADQPLNPEGEAAVTVAGVVTGWGEGHVVLGNSCTGKCASGTLPPGGCM